MNSDLRFMVVRCRFFVTITGLMLATLWCRGADETSVSADDLKLLKAPGSVPQWAESWRDGIVIATADRGWFTASWSKSEASPLKVPAGARILDVNRAGPEHHVCVRVGDRISVLHLLENHWEDVKLPEAVVNAGETVLASESTVRAAGAGFGAAGKMFIPRDRGLAFRVRGSIWREHGGTWRATKVSPLPSFRDLEGEPWGRTQFIQGELLFASTNGGEWGSFFGSYDLSFNEGPWKMIWRDGPPVQRLFQDRQTRLLAFARLVHLSLYEYSLRRFDLKSWETLVENTASNYADRWHRELTGMLRVESRLADAAPMPDGRIALLSEDEGIFVLGSGSSPCLIQVDINHLSIPGRPSYVSAGPRTLCFDDSGNAYVLTEELGILAFHKDATGPWRVRQITFPK